MKTPKSRKFTVDVNLKKALDNLSLRKLPLNPKRNFLDANPPAPSLFQKRLKLRQKDLGGFPGNPPVQTEPNGWFEEGGVSYPLFGVYPTNIGHLPSQIPFSVQATNIWAHSSQDALSMNESTLTILANKGIGFFRLANIGNEATVLEDEAHVQQFKSMNFDIKLTSESFVSYFPAIVLNVGNWLHESGMADEGDPWKYALCQAINESDLFSPLICRPLHAPVSPPISKINGTYFEARFHVDLAAYANNYVRWRNNPWIYRDVDAPIQISFGLVMYVNQSANARSVQIATVYTQAFDLIPRELFVPLS